MTQLAHWGLCNKIQKPWWTIALSISTIPCCYGIRKAIRSEIWTALSDVTQLAVTARLWGLNHQTKDLCSFFFFFSYFTPGREVEGGCFVIHRLEALVFRKGVVYLVLALLSSNNYIIIIYFFLLTSGCPNGDLSFSCAPRRVTVHRV